MMKRYLWSSVSIDWAAMSLLMHLTTFWENFSYTNKTYKMGLNGKIQKHGKWSLGQKTGGLILERL